jgi:hypothetical protein
MKLINRPTNRPIQRLGASLGALLLFTVAAPSLAAADSATSTSESTRASSRDGVILHIGIGAGRIGCATDDGDDCDGDGTIKAAGIVGEAGFMLSPSLALVGVVSGAANRDDDVELSQWVAAGAVRGWPTRRLWLEGGAGVARTKVEVMGDFLDIEAESEIVPALVGGIGAEVISADKFALDVALRGATGLYEDDVNVYQVTLGVGATFF